jgi:hypothetical protein
MPGYSALWLLVEFCSEQALTQMNPVAASAMFWLTDNLSAGLERSLRPAATNPHFATGAQKKIVLGFSQSGFLLYPYPNLSKRPTPSGKSDHLQPRVPTTSAAPTLLSAHSLGSRGVVHERLEFRRRLRRCGGGSWS